MSERSDSDSGRGTPTIDPFRSERPADPVDDARRGGGPIGGGMVLPEVAYSFLSAADPSIHWQVARIDVTEGMNQVYEATLDIATEAPHVLPDHLVGARAELLIRRDLHVRRAGPSLSSRDWTEIAGVRVLTERRLDPVAGVEEAVFRFRRTAGPEVVKRFHHRLYTPGELLALVERAGFGGARVFGDYDRRPFDTEAPFLVVHARAA